MTSSWKLVPVEPTSEMVEAYCQELRRLGFISWANASTIWPVLLSASPQPPVEGISTDPEDLRSNASGERDAPHETPEFLLRYAQDLATVAAKKVGCVPEWRPFDDIGGCLTQIDNCLTGLVAASPWQPIETCPKDGSEFDVWVEHEIDGGDRYADVHWADGLADRMEYSIDYGMRKATHWRPQPPSPQTAEASSRDHEKPPVEAWKPDRKAVARIEELEGALRPFADMADAIEDASDLVDDPDRMDDVQVSFGGMSMGEMDVSDFNRARAALLALPSQPVVGGNHE